MKYEILKTEAEVSALIEWHNTNSEFVVVDLETTGLDAWKDEIVDVQISGKDGETVAIFSGDYAHCLSALRTRAVGHNLRFDITFLFRRGVDVTHWEYHDTLLLAHLENENRDSYSLDALLKEFYGESHKEAFWSKYKTYQDAPQCERYEYGARDVDYTCKLYKDLVRRLDSQELPRSLIEHVHRLQYCLLKTEIQGVKVDEPYLVNLGVGLKSKIENLLPRMREMVGMEADLVELKSWIVELGKRKTDKGKANVQRPQFTFDSSQQLQALLYDCLELPVQRNEKTKNVSVDDASLERIKERHPVVPLIQEYREAHKIYGTYIEGTLERMRGPSKASTNILAENGGQPNARIYPEFRVAGTATGRISHSNPNLAQLPRVGGVRGIYVPDDGHVFISADYSSLEVVVEANLTDDPNLARILNEGISKHDLTSQALRVSRDVAKTLNFACQYHCTHFKVAKILGVSEEEGYEVWRRYWDTYAGCKRLKDQTDKEIDETGVITNMVGRKRRFGIRKRREFDGDYRAGYNFQIQGPGAEFTHEASYLTSERLEKLRRGRLMWEIHDELLIAVKREFAEEESAELVRTMEGISDKYNLKYPLKAVSSGPMERWED